MLEKTHIAFAPVVQLDDWISLEEPTPGSRDKLTVINPANGNYYIFKLPKRQREHQIWSELIASYIAGDLLGWDVQTVEIAMLNGRIGNLLGYIYRPGTLEGFEDNFIEGWQYCIEVDPNYDVVKGTRHTLKLLRIVYDRVLGNAVERRDFYDFWSRALALDTLISNTDRHAENWAVVESPSGEARMSSLYDNGNSLGCGIERAGLAKAFDENDCLSKSHLDKQRKNGRHHLRLVEGDKRGGCFEEVCIEFLKMYPEGRYWFENAANVDVGRVGRLMDDIVSLNCHDDPYRLSSRRCRHVIAMLNIGVKRIKNVLSMV